MGQERLSGETAKDNPKIIALQVELAQVDSLTGANNVLLSYVNVKIADLTVDTISPEQVQQISGYLDTWKI